MGIDRAFAAEEHARPEACRRPPGAERHRARPEIWLPLVGLPIRLRAAEDDLQSLRPLGRARHLGADFRGAREQRRGRRTADDRLDDREGTPLGRWRKRGARAHAIGRSKGGRTTKIHAVTDEKGRPVVLCITPGNTSDYVPAKDCIEAVPPAAHLIADKGYDSAELRDWLVARGTEPVIPPRSNRKVQYAYDRRLYRERNRIERSFNRLKDFRRIATRFDRSIKNFMAALCLAAVVIWWC